MAKQKKPTAKGVKAGRFVIGESFLQIGLVEDLYDRRHEEACGGCEPTWIVEARFAIPLAFALRQSLIDVAASRKAQEGQQTKTEVMRTSPARASATASRPSSKNSPT